MFFSSTAQKSSGGRYDLVTEAVRFADAHGFRCVWTPERHFHEFGGLFPNPSVVSAALAMITSRLQIRAGSLISPLHDPVRVVEEWSVVDNLSGGRVAVSFGSGWNADDFIFFPERYASRQAVMYDQIELVRRLWRGERVTRRNHLDKEITLSLYPRPVQEELPVWITSSGNVETFRSAGRYGANLLTHLLGQDVEALADKIRAYREARREAGHDPAAGTVTLMLHTFLGADVEEVRAKVYAPFRAYLRSAVSLERKAALSGGVISGGHQVAAHDIPAEVMEDLLDLTFDRYFHSAALMGTKESCKQLVWQLKDAGVDEIACLLDFGVADADVLEGLRHLAELRAAFSPEALGRATTESLKAFMDDLLEE